MKLLSLPLAGLSRLSRVFPGLRKLRRFGFYRRLREYYQRRQDLRSHIYPIAMPTLEVENGLDMLLLQLPGHCGVLMPLGVASVERILKSTPARCQVLDANIVFYHRYHAARLLNPRQCPRSPDGSLEHNPWKLVNFTLWYDPEFCAIFQPWLDELADRIVAARPAMVGFSVNYANKIFSRIIAAAIRSRLPECRILVGGSMFCHPGSAAFFPDADYVVIGEAEGSLPALLERRLRGEAVRDLPGVISREDSPGREFQPAPLLDDYWKFGFLRYEYAGDLSVYREFDGTAKAFFAGSRGCVWAGCRFCNEAIRYRWRPVESLWEEMVYLHDRGIRYFRFSESDFNGRPEDTLVLARRIISAGWEINLQGQLRVHPAGTADYFRTLRQAGFELITFGVDGWSDDILKLQNKGYTMAQVEENLKACHDSGIVVSANIIVGVPGESREMFEESCRNLTRLSPYLDQVGNLNAMMLTRDSIFWRNPGRYGIAFREEEEEEDRRRNRKKHSDAYWYCREPYLDYEERLRRLETVYRLLLANGVPLTAGARTLIRRRNREVSLAE